MPDRYQALREAAERATPGPWARAAETHPMYVYCDDNLGSAVLSVDDLYTPLIDDQQKLANIAYAEAAQPITITALLAERDALREALNVICDWQPPKVLSKGELVPMSVAIGSNGERDWFRDIARAALTE